MYENSTHWGNILWDDIKTLCYTKLYYVERLKGLMNIQHILRQYAMRRYQLMMLHYVRLYKIMNMQHI